MKERHHPTSNRARLLAAAGILIVVIAALVIGIMMYLKQRQTIPPSIAKQVSFEVFWPNSQNAVTDRKSIEYNSQAQVFSYTVQIQMVHTTLTEQATPSEFADVPDYFTTLINHLNNYDTFSSAYGSIYLTLPDDTTGETAIMNHNGTLLFAHAQGKISENDWRLFFNNLKIIEN